MSQPSPPHDAAPWQPDPARPAPRADEAALRRCGERVRARLAADPTVYRIPTEKAEIFAVGSFLSPAECTRMIALVDATAQPSAVFDVPGQQSFRTSYSGDVDHADPFVRMIERRFDDLLGLDPAWGEAIQGQRYQPGQYFQAHYDWFWTAAGYWPAEASRGGQRSWTAMAYLNDVSDGGVTEFPKLGFSISPQRGALLLWNNALPDGSPNFDTLHEAHPVTSGTKYIITKWYRTRTWG